MNDKLINASRLSPITALSLKTRIAVAVVALVLITTVLVTSVSLILVKRGMKDVISEQQFSLLTHLADEIDQKFLSRQAALQSLSVNIPQKSYGDAVWLQRHVEQHANLQSLFQNLLVLDVQGRQLANLNEPAARVSVNHATLRYVKDTLTLREGIISAPSRIGATQTAMLTLTVPVLDGHGEIALVLVGTVDLEQNNFLGQFEHMRIGRTGYFYIVTSNGTLVSHPNKSRTLQNVAAIEGYNSGLDSAFSGFEGTTEGVNRLSADGLQSFKRLKSTNWILGAVFPQSEAFAPIAEVEEKAILAAAILAIFVGALAWWITLRQISPLQQLRERIQAIGDNPSLVALPVQYRSDEIGELAHAFDQLMRERLFAQARYQSIEAELRAATDSSLDAFFIFHSDRDQNGQIVDFCFWYLNTNAERLIGNTQQQVQDKRLCDLLPEMRQDGRFDKYVKVIESGRAIQEEFSIQSPKIQAQWLHIQVVPVADGIAITMRDISDRKQAETEMRNNRSFLQSLIEYLPVLIFAKSFRPDAYGQLVVWNKTAEKVMGYPASKVLGKSNREIFPEKVAAALNEIDQQMLDDPKVVGIPEILYRRPDGVMCYLHSISVPLFGENGKLDYILGIVEDITNRRSQDLELRTHQAELEAVSDASPLGLFRTDAEGEYTYVNRTYEGISGLNLSSALGHGWSDSIHPHERARTCSEWKSATQSCEPYHGILRFQHADGKNVWASVKAAPIIIDERVTGYVGSVDDITARFGAEQALSQSEQRLRTITDNLPVLIAYVDREERYRFCNGHFERTFGGGKGSLLGRTIRDVLGDDGYSLLTGRIAAVLAGNRVSFEHQFLENDVNRHWRIDYIPDLVQGVKVAGFYVMVLDITELKLVENQLRMMAHLDSLTGLANRHYFDKKLNEAITYNQHAEQRMGLMFLDIDHFKAINDSDGHHGGDEVLRQFSRRLVGCVRQTDTVARLAGDEFVIILEALHTADEIASIARKIVRNMEVDFEISNIQRRVTVSIGMTILRDDEGSAETLLRRADEALYLAKSAGRNTFRIIL